MGRVSKVFGLSLVLLALVGSPVSAQADVSGKWMLTVQAPEAPGDIMAVFEQDGTTVQGALEVPMIGGSEMSDGMIEGNTFTFQLHVEFDGQWFSVDVEAEVDGDEMAGEFYMAEFGSMPFTGKRTEG